MAIFDANRTRYLTYYIVLTDPAQVTAYQAQYPTGVNRAPYNPGPPAGGAAIEFSAPFRGYTEPASGAAPYIWTPWSGVGEQDGPFPLNVARFSRHSGGFLGIGGTTITYYWIGQFVLAGNPDGVTAPTVPSPDAPAFEAAPMAQRRALDGFEIGEHGYFVVGGGGSSSNFSCSRGAARFVGGFGLAVRNTAGSVGKAANTYIGGGDPESGWRRFRIRVRQLPTSGVGFVWKDVASSGNTRAVGLGINSSGQFVVLNGNTPESTVPGFTFTIDEWIAVDLLVQTATGAETTGYFKVYINKQKLADLSFSGSNTIGDAVANDDGDIIGQWTGSAVGLEYDLDDFVQAALPPGRLQANVYNALTTYNPGDIIRNTTEDRVYKCIATSTGVLPSKTSGGDKWVRYEGLDWLNGSRIITVRPKALGAGHANWTGDYRVAAQRVHSLTADSASLSTTTAGAIAEFATDADLEIDGQDGALGVAAMLVVLQSTRNNADGNGTLGYSIGGAAFVMASIAQAAAGARGFNGVMYSSQATDVDSMPDFSSLALRHVKGTGTNSATLRMLCAQVEVIGQFGPEDFVAPDDDPETDEDESAIEAPTYPDDVGHHNAPYRHSPWAIGGLAAPPSSPFIVQGGTYVGNNTGQDLTFRAPVTMLFIRPLTSGAGGFQWMTTMHSPKKAFGVGANASIAMVKEDLSFAPATGEDAQQQRYMVQIAGSDNQLNATGVTYQYFAVCDPGMRFLCGFTGAAKSDEVETIHHLPNPSFTPEFLIAWIEDYINTGAGNPYLKGPGQAASGITQFAGATETSSVEMAEGTVTTRTAFHNNQSQTSDFAFMALRRDDGSQDTGLPGVMAIVTWIGDGSGSRTISLPASGRRPLWAMAYGESGSIGVIRDPSHTGSNSTNRAGTDGTTGITGGGVDSLSVGSALNSNGVVYNALVFFADGTAGNNGWGTNGEFIPVEANAPYDGPWPSDPDPTDYDEEDDSSGAPSPEIIEEPDLDATTALPNTSRFCADFSQKCCNVALSHIGFTKQISNINTDLTQQAITARLHLKDAIDECLRRFDWPFATRYATLTLVAGTASEPANEDWRYAYRLPVDCVKARRIVNPLVGRDYDPDPPKFRLGSDSDGNLLYTNEEDASLEYTKRMTCPAYQGDRLFKDALEWLLASKFAPALSRDTKLQAFCLQMFEDRFAAAEVPAAQEQQQSPVGDASWIEGR